MNRRTFLTLTTASLVDRPLRAQDDEPRTIEYPYAMSRYFRVPGLSFGRCRQLIGQAVQQWNRASVKFEIVGNADAYMFLFVSGPPIGKGEAWARFKGYPSMMGKIIFDDRIRWTDSRFLSYCLHEIGHMIGIAEHNPDPRSVMYYRPTATRLALSDLQTVHRIYGVD